MSTVNFIYGVLVNGELCETSDCFRFSNVSRTALQPAAASYIDKLLPMQMPITDRAAIAEVVIRLLQSYDNYEELIHKIDRINTYDTSVNVSNCIQSTDTLPTIYAWAKQCPYRLSDTYVGDMDDPITTIQKAIFAICMARR